MSIDQQIALIDRLRSLPAETEWFELKRNRFEPQQVGEYLSALANSAFLAAQPRGYLIMALVREHGPVRRQDVDQLLLPKLPDRLSDHQKRRMVNNLLQDLRRSGRIYNRGTRPKPQWMPSEPGIER